MPNEFHLSIPQWKEKAQQSDITLLDTMHVYYNLHNMFVEIDFDQLKDLAARLASLSEGIKSSVLEARVQTFFVRSLDELRFSLANIEIFGFESGWSESANLVGGVLRFRNELAAIPDLRQNAAATAWQGDARFSPTSPAPRRGRFQCRSSPSIAGGVPARLRAARHRRWF
jgi:hypothetical protein